MIGSGSIIISHSTGWSCSNDAEMSVEHDIKPDRTAVRTMVVSIKGLYDCVGIPEKDVKGVFMFDNGNKLAFNAELSGKSRLVIKGDLNNNFNIILKEVKKWQEKYKVS